jgi:O-acetyl-ADP-ribose deacetylase (regulator of RNase III)
MKIIYKTGNLLEAPERILIHGCNAQGVMGAGVALAIRKDCPELYNAYRKWCKNTENKLGMILWFYCRTGKHLKHKQVANAITQEFYGKRQGRYISYRAIRQAMNTLDIKVQHDIAEREFWDEPILPTDIQVAMPKIGAGLAGGDWNIIAKIIEEELTHAQPVVYSLKTP